MFWETQRRESTGWQEGTDVVRPWEGRVREERGGEELSGARGG